MDSPRHDPAAEAPAPDAIPAREYPSHPRVGVGAVVWRGGRVLLVRRARPPAEGEWSLPGGSQELGETLFETARREVLEETGIVVEPTAVLTAVDAIHRDEEGRIRFHYTIVDVAAEWRGGQAVPGDDVDAVRWVALPEVDALVAQPETRRVIRMSAAARRAERGATGAAAEPPTRGAGRSPRLKPRPEIERLMRPPLGNLIARPWFDEVSLRLLADWFFPMSRAWAAAIAADGDFERFCAEVPIDPDRVTPRALWLSSSLGDIAKLSHRLREAEQVWDGALFGNGGSELEDAVAAEEARLDAASALSMAKLRFALFGRARRLPACRWEIPAPALVEQRHGRRLAAPDSAYALGEPWPEVRASRRLPSALGVEYWLRFDSPDPDAAASTVASPCWARVFEPEGVTSPPTVIDLHGICVELDQVRTPLREIETLCRQGFRVIAPEAPWHGRRRRPGRYGGEPFVAMTPLGALDHFAAHVRELGVLTRWARRTGRGPVAWIGTSLGAFSCQLAAAHAHNWPKEARADALMLFTTAEGIAEIGLNGAFGRAFGVDRALTEAGWDEAALRRWQPLLMPLVPPVMGAANVFMVLGSEDKVAPFEHGMAIARRWEVPEDQVFVRRQGHFSVSAGLMVDPAPIAAFIDRLRLL